MPEGQSDFSWSLDFVARRGKAREEMAPYLMEVEKRVNEAISLKDKIATLKRAKASEKNIEACRHELMLVEMAEREAQAKADAIDAASFDLKAVNPRARVVRDTRSVSQILAK
jgi:type I restriction enzyme M protein